MPYEPPPELAGLSLEDVARLVTERKLPPLDSWTPAETGDSLMRIAADGRWFHDGGEITRPAMVRAFSGLLVRDEAGDHWLMTPRQKLAIAVEDAAFMAVDLKRDDDCLIFRLNTDDLVVAGPDHPITAHGNAETPAIYVAVRHGTQARLNRNTYTQLVEIALETAELVVSSHGARFSLLPG